MSPQQYEIRIEGHTNQEWDEWFEGLSIEQTDNGETILAGPMDQTTLYGILLKIFGVGLPLVAVSRVEED